MKEIIEKEEPVRYPPFRKACTQFSMAKIFQLAEAGYLIEIDCRGGVIDE